MLHLQSFSHGVVQNRELYPISVIRLAKCAVRKPHLPLEKDKFRLFGITPDQR